MATKKVVKKVEAKKIAPKVVKAVVKVKKDIPFRVKVQVTNLVRGNSTEREVNFAAGTDIRKSVCEVADEVVSVYKSL